MDNPDNKQCVASDLGLHCLPMTFFFFYKFSGTCKNGLIYVKHTSTKYLIF